MQVIKVSLNNRILYVCLSEVINGSEKHVLDLMEAINRNVAYEVLLVTYHGDFADRCEQLGISVIRIRKEMFMIYDLTMVIFRFKPQILHAHLGRSGLYGRILGYVLRVPIIIYTDHAWAQENYDLCYWGRSIHKFIYRLLSKITTKIIAVSPAVYDYLLNDINISSSVLLLINNGVKKKKDITKEKGLLMRFGYIGRLEDEKNVICLLKAVNLLKKERFVLKIIGDGSQKEWLQDYCIENDLEDKVIFMGYLSSDEIDNVYRQLDVVILPSKRETFGLVLAEGMMNGCPCIGSNIGGIKYIIDNGFNGYLFKSDDHYDLAKKMKTYINDPSKIMKHGINARKKALEEYCINRMVIEVEKVYDEELKKYIK